MSRNLFSLSAATLLLGGAALADVPRVTADIAPVHSLVARVMQGVGEPSLIIAPGASPHEYNLRPSEAGALQDADLVFWIGEGLTPWLSDAIGTLAADATVAALMEVDGTVELAMREDALFEAHDHGSHSEHGHDDHGHDHDKVHDDHGHDEDHDEHKHDDHDHAHEKAHDDHGHDEDHAGHDDHGHAHGGTDPHAWLSPANAATWLNAIASKLSAADPDNAGAYFANAAAGQQELDALSAEIAAILDPVRGGNFIVFHDAYQYFETAFDMSASGAISLSDATDPSPARIAEVQARVEQENVTCVLSEPQFAPGIVATVMEGVEVGTGVLDPLGSDLDPGPELYPSMLRNLALVLAECL